jgi:hypothetical protein
MCLKASVLKELMEDYPDAKKFYMKRAWFRRMEFKRKMLRHIEKLKKDNKRYEGGESTLKTGGAFIK